MRSGWLAVYVRISKYFIAVGLLKQADQCFLFLNLVNLQIFHKQISITVLSQANSSRCHEICYFFFVNLHETALYLQLLASGEVDDIFDHVVNKSHFSSGLTAKEGECFAWAGLTICQYCGIDLFLKKEGDCPLETILVDESIVIALIKHLIEPIRDDRFRSGLLDELILMRIDTNRLIVEIGLYPNTHSVFGMLLFLRDPLHQFKNKDYYMFYSCFVDKLSNQLRVL